MKADAAKIRLLLFKRGLTQTALAQEINVSRATIYSVCAEKSCSYKTLEKVARALGADPRQLILFEDNCFSEAEEQDSFLQENTFQQGSEQVSSYDKHHRRAASRPPPAITQSQPPDRHPPELCCGTRPLACILQTPPRQGGSRNTSVSTI